MRRAVRTFAGVLRERGPLWPAGLALRAAGCILGGIPRGLVVEPCEACTGGCRGCVTPQAPALLEPSALEAWIAAREAPPATIHFAGRHSDPLASPLLAGLVAVARAHASMVSVSTIGLDMDGATARLPVDRWIVSLPAATRETWRAVKGTDRFGEAVEAVRMISASRSGAVIEVVLTKWAGSAGDGPAFAELAAREGWRNTTIVHTLHDPSGSAYSDPAVLALGEPDCPYGLDASGRVALTRPRAGCPQAGYLCIDARGTLRPCPFSGADVPLIPEPSRDAWREARGWRAAKSSRSFPNCRICP